ncbi:MAG: tetratricopeptide repeat protein [Acidobacteriota bacterium]
MSDRTMRASRLKKSTLSSMAVLLLIISLTQNRLFSENAGQIRKRSFELISEGVSHYNKGNYWDAVQKLEMASNMALNSFLAHYYLGLSLYASRRYSEALEPLKIALDLDPKHLQAHVVLGDTYLKLGDHEEALAEYYRALEISKNYAPAYDGIGRYYDSIASKDKAMENFRKAIELNKGYAEAYLHMGDLYLRDGNLAEAIKLLSEAVEIRPSFPEGLNRLGMAYAKLKLYSKAITALKKAIQLTPKDPEHYQTMGEIYLDLRNLHQASSCFEKAMALDHTMVESYMGLAEISRLRGDYESALMMLRRSEGIKNLDSKVLARIEEAKTSYLRERESFASLMKELDEGKADAEKVRELAKLFASRGNYAAASSLLSRSPELFHQKAITEEYGYYLLKSGQPVEGGRLFQNIAEKWGMVAGVLINIGVAHAEAGNDEDAAESYLKALAIEPENLNATLYLANAFLRMGKVEEARKRYQQFINKEGKGPEAERVKEIISLLEEIK